MVVTFVREVVTSRKQRSERKKSQRFHLNCEWCSVGQQLGQREKLTNVHAVPTSPMVIQALNERLLGIDVDHYFCD